MAAFLERRLGVGGYRLLWSQAAFILRRDIEGLEQVVREALNQVPGGVEARAVWFRTSSPPDVHRIDDLIGELSTRRNFGEHLDPGVYRATHVQP